MAVVIVRQGDEYPVTFDTNVAIDGAQTVTLTASLEGVGTPISLACDVTGPMEVTHVLDGTLPVGRYRVEVRATWVDSGPVSFPTAGGAYLEVLDSALPIPFAYPSQLSAFTNGDIAESDPRAALLLAGVTASIQRYCGWHIAPARAETVTLDGTGGNTLYLPSLKVNSITSITVEGEALDLSLIEWSRITGMVRRNDHLCFPDVWGGIVVTFNSGYATVPPALVQIVLQVAAIALSSPTGATREQAGQVSMAWALTSPGVAGGMALLQRDYQVLDQYMLPKEV